MRWALNLLGRSIAAIAFGYLAMSAALAASADGNLFLATVAIVLFPITVVVWPFLSGQWPVLFMGLIGLGFSFLVGRGRAPQLRFRR